MNKLLTFLLALMWTGAIYGADPSPITGIDATGKAGNQPNILIILADDFGWEQRIMVNLNVAWDAQTATGVPTLHVPLFQCPSEVNDTVRIKNGQLA